MRQNQEERFEQIIDEALEQGSWTTVVARMRGEYIPLDIELSKVVAIGDFHGVNPLTIMEDLHRIGFLDRNFQVKNEAGRILVQMGDVVDRGAFSLEDYLLLEQLQEQAPAHVIRLLGNHDLAHLIGQPYSVNARHIPGLQEMLIKDILDKKIIAAWSDGETLYTHAGLDLKYFPKLSGAPLDRIVEKLNDRFLEAVEWFAKASKAHSNPDYIAECLLASDKIFGSRGIFWTRGDIGNDQFKQVVGHTPQIDGITVSPDRRVTYIDTGRVFAESGRFDEDNAREIFTNDANSCGIKYLAAHPETYKRYKDGKI